MDVIMKLLDIGTFIISMVFIGGKSTYIL